MRRARWAGALAAVALAVSGCGGSDLQDVVDDPSIAPPGTREEGAPDGPLTEGETPAPQDDAVEPSSDPEQE